MTAAIRRSGLKAVMSGEGSDELFGGYPYFGIEKIWRMPKPGRALREFRIREAHSRGILWDDGAAWKKTSPVYGYASAYHLRVLRTQSTMRRLFSRSFLASMPSLPLDVAMREHAPAELRALAPFDATRVIARSMPGLGDRVEMASSLEGRVPYLDRDVVALAYSLGEEDCIDAGSLVQKSVLRRAFGDLLPKGFRAPAKTTLMAPSFKELAHTPLGGSIVHELTSKESIRRAGIFDPTFVRALGAAWRLWPRGDRRHAQLDLLFGFVLCAQALHHVLIEDGLRRRSSLSLLPLDEDRSPGPPEAGAGAPGSS
jgi:asparagine synthase (glutamine-hydrolysing)